MRVGTCIQCKNYRHLPEKGKCKSCVKEKNSEEWELIFGYAGTAPKVVEEGLSREKANKKAKDMKYIYARKRC